MKITIQPTPVITGTINAEMFKNVICTTFDLKQAISKSMVINQNSLNMSSQQIKDYIRWQLDWGDMIDEIHKQPNKKLINFKILQIYNDKREVYDINSTNLKEFNFVEKNAEPIEGIVVQDLIPQANYTLALNLSRTTFAFHSRKWKPLIQQE